MPTYVHRWRRKVGCVTFVMACVFIGGWIRSYWVLDAIKQSGNGYDDTIGSARGFIYVAESGDNNAIDGPLYYDAKILYSDSKIYFLAAIPYWSIVIPLTLLSIYLIMFKSVLK